LRNAFQGGAGMPRCGHPWGARVATSSPWLMAPASTVASPTPSGSARRTAPQWLPVGDSLGRTWRLARCTTAGGKTQHQNLGICDPSRLQLPSPAHATQAAHAHPSGRPVRADGIERRPRPEGCALATRSALRLLPPADLYSPIADGPRHRKHPFRQKDAAEARCYSSPSWLEWRPKPGEAGWLKLERDGVRNGAACRGRAACALGHGRAGLFAPALATIPWLSTSTRRLYRRV